MAPSVITLCCTGSPRPVLDDEEAFLKLGIALSDLVTHLECTPNLTDPVIQSRFLVSWGSLVTQR